VRVVLDVNVLVSALLSPDGAPARVLVAWLEGAFELIVSPRLLDELRRVLAYPKISRRIRPDDAALLLRWVAEQAIAVSDPDEDPPVRSMDPGDDYLIALAASADALLVSGDAHLTALIDQAPILTPAQLADRLLRP
jgi:putative PIN family toxin of toxin-antitoxin system